MRRFSFHRGATLLNIKVADQSEHEASEPEKSPRDGSGIVERLAYLSTLTVLLFVPRTITDKLPWKLSKSRLFV